MKQNWCGFFL